MLLPPSCETPKSPGGQGNLCGTDEVAEAVVPQGAHGTCYQHVH